MAKFIEIETPHRLVKVSEIKLYHAKAVAHWKGMLASAQEKMGGVQTGLGFIGSPEWVITGSLVLGAIEGALSSASAKAGMKILGEAGNLMAEMHRRAIFFPVSSISGVESPRPGEWNAEHQGVSFISLGEDFLLFKTIEQIEVSIRWSAISSFRTVIE